MEDRSIHLFYSVRADGSSALGLSLDLSSNEQSISILVAEDIATFTRKKQHHKYDTLKLTRWSHMLQITKIGSFTKQLFIPVPATN